MFVPCNIPKSGPFKKGRTKPASARIGTNGCVALNNAATATAAVKAADALIAALEAGK